MGQACARLSVLVVGLLCHAKPLASHPWVEQIVAQWQLIVITSDTRAERRIRYL